MDDHGVGTDSWIHCMHFAEIDSTQSYVERSHESFDQDKLTVVSADYQTAGRGTRDRVWCASPAQSVLATFFFRFPADCTTEFVNQNAVNSTQVLAVSAVEILEEVAGSKQTTFGIKWPNDIVVNGLKLGGILARAVASPGPRLDGIVLGIGININTEQEDLNMIERPVWPATSLRVACQSELPYDVAMVRSMLAARLSKNLQRFFRDGFGAFRQRVNHLEVHAGLQVRFRVSDTQVLRGVFVGLDNMGHIILRGTDGNEQSYPSGEIIPDSPR